MANRRPRAESLAIDAVVLELMSDGRPHSPKAIFAALAEMRGIRSGVHVIDRLTKAGVVKRLDKGFVVRGDVPTRASAPLPLETRLVSSASARLLSSLREGQLTSLRLLNAHLGSILSETTRRAKQLAESGHLTVLRLGHENYVTISEAGLAHPQFDPARPPAPLANVYADFGQTRAVFLQLLAAKSPLRTRDLTRATEGSLLRRGSGAAGPIVTGLEEQGLIDRVENGDRSRPAYRLSSKGIQAAALITLVHGAPEQAAALAVQASSQTEKASAGALPSRAHHKHSSQRTRVRRTLMDQPAKPRPAPRTIELGTTQAKVLALVAEPRTTLELVSALRLSRQRLGQVLSALEKRKLIVRRRTSEEAGRFVVVASDKSSALAEPRHPRLRSERARLLSALREHRVYKLLDVADLVGQAPQTTSHMFKTLEEQGLVVRQRVGKAFYLTITAWGLGHPQFDPAFPEAPTANLREDFGGFRTNMLQVLQVAGPLRTVDLIGAMDPGVVAAGPKNPSRTLRLLQDADLVQAIEAEGSRRPCYGLTQRGVAVAGMLARVYDPPRLEAVQQRIETTREERSRARRALMKVAFTDSEENETD